jgi:hypothetical protein
MTVDELQELINSRMAYALGVEPVIDANGKMATKSAMIDFKDIELTLALLQRQTARFFRAIGEVEAAALRAKKN